MTKFVLDVLRSGGVEPVLAHYEPYGMTPKLSTPIFALGQRRPGNEIRQSFGGVKTYAIGTWLPELEFMHYRPGRMWERLMDECQRFVSVSGNVLAATPFAHTDRPFMAWVAAGWEEDRKDRVQRFPFYRKLIDRMVTRPKVIGLERKVLQAGHILALSQVTASVLNTISGQNSVKGVMPMPVDSEQFKPVPDKVKVLRIGFSGRFSDPRKNIELLVSAFAQLLGSHPNAELVLIGGQPDLGLVTRLQRLGIQKSVIFPGYLSRVELAALLPSFDVFVVPSHQEGLCIAALEAMACGVPVISTKCGGPEEFVIDGETGFLVAADAQSLLDAVLSVVENRALRKRLSEGARQLVCERYSVAGSREIFWQHFENHNQVKGEELL